MALCPLGEYKETPTLEVVAEDFGKFFWILFKEKLIIRILTILHLKNSCHPNHQSLYAGRDNGCGEVSIV